MRIMHPTVWKELTAAWAVTFGEPAEPLINESLGKPHSIGPNAFPDEERDWCEQNSNFFCAAGESRAASPPHAREGGEAAA